LRIDPLEPLQLQREHFPVDRLRASRQSIDELLVAAL